MELYEEDPFSFGGGDPTPKYIYSHFNIHIGIHPSKTGMKLVYYYLYDEEASPPLDVCTHPFNKNFLLKIQTYYLSI